MGEAVLWIVAGVLLASTVALVVAHRRSTARWSERLASVEAARAARESELRTAHAASLHAASDAHAFELRRSEEDAEESRVRAERLRSFASRGIRHEASSRETIVRMCDASSIDAVLATNVVFMPVDLDDEFFTAQIDHVLLTEWGCLIIESKNWDGVIFDGVRPREIHRSYGLLVDRSREDHADQLESPFAIQLVPSSTGPIKVRVHQKSKAPAGQVRLQAKRLRELVETRLGLRPFFNTCVYYSHPLAQVHAKRRDTAASTFTHVVSNERELQTVIAGLRSSSRSGLPRDDMRQLATLFSSLGADVIGTGSFDAEWQSLFPMNRARHAQQRQLQR
ncbi:nuclease-related domain-containing protein [Agromyces italicus]|uniref:nuclease-related domain-containing protein n=1 Tax=Agromyces italicus TaxID=279572 RepID=UPI001FE02C3B|nr:nuclease-related domain-containing protein [Agromyces italicus]